MHDPLDITIDATGLRIAIVMSRYHAPITGAMRDAAVARFRESGGQDEHLLVVTTPGTFELTAVCRSIAETRPIDAIVALGCVITGETEHDRYIAQSVVEGLTQVIVRSGVPVAFGVLTCASVEQARARAGGDRGNKGAQAMAAAIETAATIRAIRHPSRKAEA